MALTNEQLMRAMALLGVSPQDFDAIERATSSEEAERLLGELKVRAKKRFKQLAMELHPDRTNNDPAKTEDFKLVSNALEELERIAFAPKPPKPVVIRVRFTVSDYSWSSTGSHWDSTL